MFLSLCRSLARDGLTYNVHFDLADEIPHLLVRASANVKRRRLKLVAKPYIPLPPRHEQCSKRLGEADKTAELIRRSYARRWRYEFNGSWQETDRKRKLLGRWLAKRLRVNPSSAVTTQDYMALDRLLGHRVRRLSEISERYRPASIKAYL